MATGSFTSPIQIPPGSIGNAHLSNQAGDIIDASKVQPNVQPWSNMGFAIGASYTTGEHPIYTAIGGETIRGFHVQMTSTTSTSITVDLFKNGVSILSSVLTFNTTATRAVQDGTLSSTSLASGDQLSVKITVSTATGSNHARAWCNITLPSLPS